METDHTNWLFAEASMAGTMINPEPLAGNWFLARKERSVRSVTEILSAAKRRHIKKKTRHESRSIYGQ